MKHEIKTVKQNQLAIPELGKEAKTLYYLIIGEGENKIIINIGEKTHNSINELNKTKTK